MSKAYEAARQKAAKEYKARLEEARQEIRELREKNDRLLQENLELEAKVEQLTDWIERLLEYTELSPEEAKQLRGNHNRADIPPIFLIGFAIAPQQLVCGSVSITVGNDLHIFPLGFF